MDNLSAGVEATAKANSTDRATEPAEATEVYRAIFDALPDQIAVIDHMGVITYINEAWRKFARENGDPDMTYSGVGVNYLNISLAAQGESSEGSLTAADGILSVLRGTADYFESEYP